MVYLKAVPSVPIACTYRKELVELMMSDEDEGQAGDDSSLSQLIDIRKEISDISKRLSKLKQLSAAIPPSSDKSSGASELTTVAFDTKQSSCEPDPAGEVTTGVSNPGKSSTLTSHTMGATAQFKGHVTVPSVNQRDSSVPAKDEGHATSPPDTHQSNTDCDSVLEVKGQEVPTLSQQSDEVKNCTTDHSTLQNIEVKDQQPSSVPIYVPDNSGVVESKLAMTVEVNVDKMEDQLQVLGGDASCQQGFEWDTISDPGGDGVVERETSTEIAPALTAEVVERDGDTVLPTFSKSYGSVTSSSPHRSLPAYDPGYYRLQHRAKSLPPQPQVLTHDNPLAVGPYMLPAPHQLYRQPSIPLANPVNPRSDFIPIPSLSGMQHATRPRGPPLGSSHTTPTVFPFSTSPEEWPSISESRSPPKSSQEWSTISRSRSPPKSSQTTPTYAALAGSPPKSSTIAATPPTSALSHPGSPPKASVMAPLLPFQMSAAARPDGSPNLLAGDSLTAAVPVVAQTSLAASVPSAAMKLAASSKALVGSVSQPNKRRPVGIGRGGRPLPPLDNKPGGGYPLVQPIVPPQYFQLPRYNVVPHIASRKGLLPPPPYPPLATPTATPIPIAPEERWIYMNHRRHYGCGGKYDDFPPMGSGAGLDII